ncbi:MAG: alcohol dehydrogenase, partial [Sphingomonadales bacterium]
MKAAVLREIGRFEIESLVLDKPRDEEIRVRTLASGLCHSDYHVMVGAVNVPRPLVAGHEAAGIVEAIGDDVRDFRVGDMVVTCVTGYCGACRECQSGHNYRCETPPRRGPWRDDPTLRDTSGEPVYALGQLGAFAEEMLVHQRYAAKLPEGVPVHAAALMGCAVLTGVGAALNGAQVAPGSTVVVIGCGGVGLNVVQGARIAGAGRIIAVDRVPEKLEMARRFGATDALIAGADTVAEVIEMTRGGADYAFEVIGLPETMRDACRMLRRGATAV